MIITNWLTFLCGILFTVLLAGLVGVLVAHRRHRCKYCLALGEIESTKKICRIDVLPTRHDDPVGFKMVRVFVFRSCCRYRKHVSCRVVTEFMPLAVIDGKPSDELDFSSAVTRDLFKRAGMKNPSSTPWEVDLRGK